MVEKLRNFGESQENIAAYKAMITKLQRPFDELETEYKCLEYFKKIGSYIPPEEIKINCKDVLIGKKKGTVSIEKKITIQFIPLRNVLKKFFEQPRIFQETMNYNDSLNKYNLLISNIIQADNWKLKKESFDDRLVLPMLLYQDDFETNNPLGTHRGIGKIGGVYIVIPCLPPSIQSKTENIFLLTLYKYSDQMDVSLHDIFAKAMEELQFLEQKGISISTSSGLVDVYFSLAGVIGDNLAVHTILGFMKSFSANFPCRVCLINNSEINSVLKTSMCQLRTEENYLQLLTMNQPSLTGIAGPSVLSKLTSSSTINLITVDIMHDILEGICEYDLGLLLYHYVVTKKFFTCEDLNNKINGFYYGDEIRNKPREINMIKLKNKHIKMSTSEMLCFLRNIGLLIGHYIPTDDQHWKIVIVLKEILDIITATVVHGDLADHLESLIEEYLELVTLLFPEYAEVLKLLVDRERERRNMAMIDELEHNELKESVICVDTPIANEAKKESYIWPDEAVLLFLEIY
ncbi:PREDICTED: uncharacterized protein LOC108769975 [Trachymyrmex cornetzi]|uniref:uncharacterized protein LOC108769975 n=1 Tax=Trachymyrmex cornetzi TaxID=471704 RepID=UPI00084F1DA0|nr:PREDICTED: uncharacterized protein LOC108769975 [Trachymyrmex cornetzi]